MSQLSRYLDIYNLTKDHEQEAIDLAALASQIAEASKNLTDKTLFVRRPKLYALQGQEKKHYAEAAKALGSNADNVMAVDFFGRHGDEQSDEFIFLSGGQVKADALNTEAAYLFPLFSNMYKEHGTTLQQFAVHEAIAGRIRQSRATLALEDIAFFPQRFRAGPYTLSMELDTPKETIGTMVAVNDTLAEIKANPKLGLLDGEKLATLVETVNTLNERIGGLGKYTVPDSTALSVPSNFAQTTIESTKVYFLYNPNTDKNVAIYFGENPFDETPRQLKVINGMDEQNALEVLYSLGYYQPDEQNLTQKVDKLQGVFDAAVRKQGKSSFSSIDKVLFELHDLQKKLSDAKDPAAQRQVVRSMPNEYLEFVLSPAIDCPPLQDMLTKLSWNAAVRTYAHTPTLKTMYSTTPNHALSMVEQSMSTGHPQNIQANNWLYANAKQACLDHGFRFQEL